MNDIEKTRELLKNYKKLKYLLKDKKMQLEELEIYGLSEKSADYIDEINVQVTSQNVDPITLKESVKHSLNHEIHNIERLIFKLDNSLEAVKDDRYYNIINYRYFKNLTYSQISRIICLDRSNVCRNDKRLIQIISSFLFS